jgi:nucleoside-diphosphate-sugar epimerase
MKILVLGASGGTGVHFVKSALEKGHEITALVRDPIRFEREILERKSLLVLNGSPTDTKLIEEAVREVDVVFVTLGLNRKTRNPWAKPTSPNFLISESVANLLRAATHMLKVKIVYVSAYGVGGEWNKLPWIVQKLIRYSNIWLAYLDHNRAENVLRKSGVRWTILQPVALTDSLKPEVPECVASSLSVFDQLSKKSLAEFALSIIESGTMDNETIIVRAQRNTAHVSP